MATGITYAPMSNLITSIDHGNGLVTTAAKKIKGKTRGTPPSYKLKFATTLPTLQRRFPDGLKTIVGMLGSGDTIPEYGKE